MLAFVECHPSKLKGRVNSLNGGFGDIKVVTNGNVNNILTFNLIRWLD